MSDMVIIVTRMKGRDKEFLRYFSNKEWAVTFDCKNEVQKISINTHCELAYDSKIILVYVDGMKVQNVDNHRNLLSAFLNNATDNEKEIFILVHPGVNYDVQKAERRILNPVEQNNSVKKDKKYTIADYSESTDEEAVYEQVKCLASAIQRKDNNIQHYIDIVKEYIKKKAYKLPPIHLIALFILCKGYLAAQGKVDLPKQLSISEIETTKTKERFWWKHALNDIINGIAIEDSEIGKELKTLGKNIDEIQLLKLIQDTAYFENGNLITIKINDFTAIVNETYEKLSEILESSF